MSLPITTLQQTPTELLQKKPQKQTKSIITKRNIKMLFFWLYYTSYTEVIQTENKVVIRQIIKRKRRG